MLRFKFVDLFIVNNFVCSYNLTGKWNLDTYFFQVLTYFNFLNFDSIKKSYQWHVILEKSSNSMWTIWSSFTCLCPKYINLVFKIREMVEKMKTEVDRLLFVLIIRKNPKYFVKPNFFSFLKSNVVYLRPFLSSLPFPKFWKKNFMYFEHKHVET